MIFCASDQLVWYVEFIHYVRGEHTRESDIDILVEFTQPVGLFEFVGLEDWLF